MPGAYICLHLATSQRQVSMRASAHSSRQSLGQAVISVNVQRRHQRSRQTRGGRMCRCCLRRCALPSRWICVTCRTCRTSSAVFHPKQYFTNRAVLVHHQRRLRVTPQVCVCLGRGCANWPCVQCSIVATEHCRSHDAYMLACRPHPNLSVRARPLPLLHDCMLPFCVDFWSATCMAATSLHADAWTNTSQPQKPSRSGFVQVPRRAAHGEVRLRSRDADGPGAADLCPPERLHLAAPRAAAAAPSFPPAQPAPRGTDFFMSPASKNDLVWGCVDSYQSAHT